MSSEDPRHGEPPEGTEAEARPVTPGVVVGGRYCVVEPIGHGGMGTVYLAEHETTGGRVALKVLHRDRLTKPRNRQRFELEARNAAALHHANTVRVYDYGIDESWNPGLPFIAMEYVDGVPLSKLIRQAGRLPWRRVVRIASQVLKSLWEAHENPRRIIHSDIKAANLLVLDQPGENDFVKVVDFGVARSLVGPSGDSTERVGSPATMAPEQWLGTALGPGTDLYGLGCTVYEMLAGRRPFEANTLVEMCRLHLKKRPEPLASRAAGDTPEALMGWVEALMRKEVQRRPPSAREALRQLTQTEMATSPPRGAPPPPVSRPAPVTGPVSELDETIPEASGFGDSASSLFTATPLAVQLRTNLTPTFSHFVGRATERGMLVRLFDSGARLVTVHGPGGTGKTRLSREWGIDRLTLYEGGVWFCDLTQASTLDGVVTAIASALGVPVVEADPLTHIGAGLSHRGPTLLILDNVEQVIEPVREALTAWRVGAPEVQVLATSRQPLGLYGEHILALEPLSLPPAGRVEDVEGLMESEAVALFVQRASAANPRFSLDEGNAEAVSELVRQLDGLPLAIELAAARSKVLPPKRLLANLSRRFEVLRDRTADVTDRQATLLATIEWSWQRLEAVEQDVLSQCAVFQGGFDLDAAEAVVDLSVWPESPWVVDVIESLSDRSLLRVDTSDEESRFSMLVSIQDFATRKLAEEGAVTGPDGVSLTGVAALEVVGRRHAEHYARYGEEDYLERLGNDSEALPALQAERDNLVATWRYGLAQPGSVQLALGAHQAVRELARRQGPPGLAVETARSLIDREDLSADERLGLRLDLATVTIVAGDVEAGEGHLAQAQALHDRLGNAHWTGRLSKEWGMLRYLQGRFEEAQTQGRVALEAGRRSGDRRGELEARTILGGALILQGDMAAALAHFQSGLRVAQQLPDFAQASICQTNIGVTCADMDRNAEARSHLREAVRLARQIGERRTERWARMNLSAAARALGDFREAHEELAKSLRMAERDGDRRLVRFCRINRATLDLDQGHHDIAREAIRADLLEAGDDAESRFEAMLLQLAVRMHLELGEIAAATSHIAGYLERTEALGDPLESVAASLLAGRLAVAEGRREDADARFSEALAAAERASYRKGEGDSAGQLAVVRALAGLFDEAQALADRAVEALRAIANPFALAVALCQRALVASEVGDQASAQLDLAEARDLAGQLEVGAPSVLTAWLKRAEAAASV